MADSTLNNFVSRGTAAQRAAFTPSPPTPASGNSPGYFFYETDTGKTYTWDGSAWDLAAGGSNESTRSIVLAIDGGGVAISTGVKADVYVPYACTITAVTMLADQSGSAVVDIWKDTYANFPPTVADTITASAKPTISAATKSQDTTLTGWTVAVAAGSILRFNVDSASTITRLHLALTVTL